jgi:hypothetical protein
MPAGSLVTAGQPGSRRYTFHIERYITAERNRVTAELTFSVLCHVNTKHLGTVTARWVLTTFYLASSRVSFR